MKLCLIAIETSGLQSSAEVLEFGFHLLDGDQNLHTENIYINVPTNLNIEPAAANIHTKSNLLVDWQASPKSSLDDAGQRMRKAMVEFDFVDLETKPVAVLWDKGFTKQFLDETKILNQFTVLLDYPTIYWLMTQKRAHTDISRAWAKLDHMARYCGALE